MKVILRLKTVKILFISKGYVKLKYYENIGISVSGLTYIFHLGYLYNINTCAKELFYIQCFKT